MKKIQKIVTLAFLMTIGVLTFAQNPPQDSIVWDGEGRPLYLRNQMIVKFHPDLVNTEVVDNRNIQSGIISEFINPLALELIIESGYFNEEIANLSIKKIHHNMTTSETTTITRIGEEMEIPKFWSTFLIEWSSIAGMSFEAALDTLNTLWPMVEYAHPNYIYQLFVLPNDVLFVAGEQAGLHPTATFLNCNININPAWDLTVGRDNVRVGVYDGGINWDHEDYSQDNSGTWAQSRVKGGWDWKRGIHPSAATNIDLDGHGSSCAGIIGAIRNNDMGVAGVAGGNGANFQWGVDLYDLKIAENNSYIKESDIADAITEGATSFNGTYGYSLNVQNHSWGGPNMGTALNDAIRYSYRNNVVLSVASGNDFNTTISYPATARDEWVMKVGANDQNGSRANFSTYGNSLDFIAPGVRAIYATTDALSNTTYSYNQDGTSFAAPHAAGVAGLMLSYINSPSNAPNNLAPDDVENLLQRFATDVGSPGYDDQNGFGRINAGATLQGIRWPIFEVRHYTQTFNNSSATKIGSNTQIQVVQGANGIAAGTYIGDVYEITHTFNISQPSGRTILDVWKRNSSSTLYANQPVIAEVNSIVSSWDQTTATMKGYIFDIKTNIIGQSVNRWLPSHGLSGTGRMSLTVYSEDPLASGISMIPIDNNFTRVVPNPSNGNPTIMFTLSKTTELGIEVTDITGKVVYSQPMQKISEGHQEIELQLQNLNSGIYICNLRTNSGTVSQKISIAK